jgi:hypothetical protein
VQSKASELPPEPTPIHEEEQPKEMSRRRYLIVVGRDANFDKEEFKSVAENQLHLKVSINTIEPESDIVIYDDGHAIDWSQWFRTYIAGNVNVGSHQVNGDYSDVNVDQTAEILGAIDEIESSQVGGVSD